MENIRIGNDINVQWAITYSDGTPFDLSNRDLVLYLITPINRILIKDFTIQNNVINWYFYGKDQEHLGKYTLTLVVNQNNMKMLTVDTVDLFKLISYIDAASSMVNKTTPYTVVTSTNTNITPISPIIPVIGKNGTWVVNGKDTGISAIGGEGKSAFDIWRSIEGNENKTEEDFLNWLQEPSQEAVEKVDELNKAVIALEERDVVLSESEFNALEKVDENKFYYVYADEV